MSDEEMEKEAIGWLSALEIKREYEAISKQIILKLIEKQQAEIERLEKQSKNLDKEAQSYLEELMGDSGMKERTIAQLQAELEEQTNDNKELNKVLIHFKAVINEMAEQLVKLREESEEDCFIPRIYRDINECVKTNCKECIKQYFIEKVSE